MSDTRKLLVEICVDWDGYDDVCDELLLDDIMAAGKSDSVSYRLVATEYRRVVKVKPEFSNYDRLGELESWCCPCGKLNSDGRFCNHCGAEIER